MAELGIRFDPDVDAAYITLSHRNIKTTRELSRNPTIIVDYDKDERVVGVEIIGVQLAPRFRRTSS